MAFREMTRKNQELELSECVEILKREKRGVLSVIGDEGYPYGMPMNHFYNDEDGAIYFHCGKGGYRNDALKVCDKVSFCVYDEGVKKEGEWAFEVRSVIVFGRIEMVEEPEKIVKITRELSRKFTQDEEYIQKEIEGHAHRTVLLKLAVENICGKRVTEA